MADLTKKNKLTGIAILSAVLIILTVSGIGFIQLPIINATSMHIPVILGAILFGPTAGGALGAVFGILSALTNYFSPGDASFAFSPLLATSFASAVKALWIGFGCRVLLGIAAGWIWKMLKGLHLHDIIALPIAAATASIWHTTSVMGSVYFLFATEYATAKQVTMQSVSTLVVNTITDSGVPEAIAAAVLVTVIGFVSLIIIKRKKCI